MTLIKVAVKPEAAPALVEEASGLQGELTLACESGIGRRVDLGLVWRLVTNTAARSMAMDGLPNDCPFSIDDLLDIGFDPVAAAQMISAAVSPCP